MRSKLSINTKSLRFRFSMKRILFMTLVIMLSAQSITTNAWASWAGITPQQAVSQADVILIGTIQGPVGEEKLADGLWTTEWKVQVAYYLKGKVKAKELVVNTPGAKGKSIQTSVDYPLDEKGKQVLLFLRQREGFYEPLSPQGVVRIDLRTEGSNNKNSKRNIIRNSQDLVNNLEIIKADYQPKELGELKGLLAKTNLKAADENKLIEPEYQSTWFTAKILPALVILSSFVGLLLGFLWLTRHKKPAK